MSEPSAESLMTWRFIRRHSVRIVGGAVLVTAVSIAVFVWMPYQRELRIARKIEAVGGKVDFQFCGPSWIPQLIRKTVPLFDRIQYVNLHGTEAVPADVLAEFGSLHGLEGLGLGGTQIAGLEQLKGIVRFNVLVLSGTKVTDAGLEHVQGLRNLKDLQLYETHVTDAGLEHLKGLTSLRILHIRGTPIDGTGLAFLKGFSNLRWLCLSDSGITDAGLEHLNHLTSLEELWLDGTHVTNVGLKHLEGMTGLRKLNLPSEPQTTASGRATLRKALPGCVITPEP